MIGRAVVDVAVVAAVVAVVVIVVAAVLVAGVAAPVDLGAGETNGLLRFAIGARNHVPKSSSSDSPLPSCCDCDPVWPDVRGASGSLLDEAVALDEAGAEDLDAAGAEDLDAAGAEDLDAPLAEEEDLC